MYGYYVWLLCIVTMYSYYVVTGEEDCLTSS